MSEPRSESVSGKRACRDAEHIAAALRARVLHLVAQDLDLPPSTAIIGILIDTALADRVISWVALAEGSVSRYGSDGSGTVGCGLDVEVRRAAIDLVRQAEGVAAELASQSSHTKCAADVARELKAGEIRLIFLTASGARALVFSEADLLRANAATELYVVAQQMMQLVERRMAGRSLQHEIAQATANEAAAAVGEQTCLSVGNVVRRLRI